MPAGKALAPGAVPLHLPFLAGGRELPQREVGDVALFAELDALARFQSLDVESREVPVVVLLRGVEIDAVGGPVRVTVLLEVDDEIDLLAQVVGRLAQHRRRLDVEALHVDQEGVGVELRDLPGGLAGAPAALLHLVLAGVAVGREMADVGDVHHVLHRKAVPLEHATQRVDEHERPEVADVLIVVDGRAARIEADIAIGVQRHEGAQRARVVVVERQRVGHGLLRNADQIGFAIT